MPQLTLFLSGLLLGIAAQTAAQAASDIADPYNWYQESYGPLWLNSPEKNVQKLMGYYAKEVSVHAEDGGISVQSQQELIETPMAAWFAEGWLTAELTGLKMNRINTTTASYKAKWLDSYKSGDTEVSCGWYLADWINDSWSFTAYADIDCATHGL
ncbi:MAG: hypothetical protein AB8B86_16750 [Pseudomonadales bacterium]